MLSPAALPQPPCAAGSGRLAWEQMLFLEKTPQKSSVLAPTLIVEAQGGGDCAGAPEFWPWY